MHLLMMGTGPFAVPTLRSLLESEHLVVGLVTQPTRPGRRVDYSNPMRELAESRDLPVFTPENVNDPAVQHQLHALGPELLVVCDYGQILTSQTLGVAPLGGINLHASILPKYRGAAPVQWAIYNGETETGVSVIHMTPRLDAGPCLVQLPTSIAAEETAVTLEERLARIGVSAVHDAILKIASSGGANAEDSLGIAQDPAKATRAPRLKKGDGLVDWSRTAGQIKNQVRAMKPWPTTYTFWHPPGRSPVRLILDEISLGDLPMNSVPAGNVVLCDRHRLVVAAGCGAISVQALQPSGKRRMVIEEFLRGNAIGPDDHFGDGR